jgi:two-component system OmpR family sensor kinase
MSNVQKSLARPRQPSSELLLETLERLLLTPTNDTVAARSFATDLISEATGADKVDIFMFDSRRNSLVAVGSNQPLSALQRELGLDVLPIANGGRVVHVYLTGQTFVSGALDKDAEELRGIKDGLKIKSKLGVPLDIAGKRRGMMMIASLQRDYFTPQDVRLAESAARWIGIILDRAEMSSHIASAAREEGRRAVAEEIVTVLAHDLRNYFSPLKNRLTLLRYSAEQDKRSEDLEHIAGAERGMTRLMGLVDDLLDVARIDRGFFSLDPRPIDVVEVIEDIGQTMGTGEKPVDVRVQSTHPLIVNGDASRLRQCFENVIGNALQKSPQGVPVMVRVLSESRDGAPWVGIEITDQGPGIPEEVLPQIFEQFRTTRRSEGGLGLGLHIARRIVEVHGGQIGAESMPDRGARFTIFLPCLSSGRLR